MNPPSAHRPPKSVLRPPSSVLSPPSSALRPPPSASRFSNFAFRIPNFPLTPSPLNPVTPRRPPASAFRASRGAAFTLIELMVAGAITTLMLLGMTGIFDQSMKVWRLSSRRADAEREVRAALATIQRDLKGMVIDSNYPLKYNILDTNQVSIPAGRIMPAVSGLKDRDWSDVSGVLFFASAQRTSTNRGDVYGVGYYVAWDTNAKAYNLYRRIQQPNELLQGVLQRLTNPARGPYHTNTLADAEVVAANVLNFWAYLAAVASTNATPFDVISYVNDQIPPTNVITRPSYVQLELTAYGNEAVRGLTNRSDWSDTNNIRKFGRTYLWRVDL